MNPEVGGLHRRGWKIAAKAAKPLDAALLLRSPQQDGETDS